MCSKLRSVLAVSICLFLIMPDAFGWNSIGHMASAEVAYKLLTTKQQTRVIALLKLNPDYKLWLSYIPAKTSVANRDMYIFMMAATWPDEIKESNSGYKKDGDIAPNTPEATSNAGYTDKTMHEYWHFVDVPFSMDGTSPLPPTPSVNAQTQIAALRKDIASDEADAVKSFDLAWLMHLVGDVHQPLHCSTRITAGKPSGDEGGNLVVLTGSPDELHAYWDDLLGDGSTKNFSTAVAAAKLLGTPDAAAAADLNEADWVQESFRLAQSNVYVDPPIGPALGPYTASSSATYKSNSLELAQKQIALAGARLAGVINAELK